MKVTLLTHTPDPQRYVAAAAKLCYAHSSAEELTEMLSEDEIGDFLDILISLHHESPLEHVSFTFAIDGVSRALTHQLVRHRLASYSQQSQRYVKLDGFEYVIPPQIDGNPEARRIFVEAMESDQKSYNELVAILYRKRLDDLRLKGVDEEKAMDQAEKLAIEDARYVFPNACETKIVVTMNARTLLNFFSKRCCERAQWEIRAMAVEMLKIVKGIAPRIFAKSGPGCVGGACPEGVMTCGKPAEIRARFESL
jgi:thymidylate synthase (FAD)